DPGMGIPLWIGEPGYDAFNNVDTSRAVAAGLTCRPVLDTIRDTLAWDLARGGPIPGDEGFPAAEEERLLSALAGEQPGELATGDGSDGGAGKRPIAPPSPPPESPRTLRGGAPVFPPSLPSLVTKTHSVRKNGRAAAAIFPRRRCLVLHGGMR